eukprot:jgi/Tetstr1/439529/TSEL_027958.t1
MPVIRRATAAATMADHAAAAAAATAIGFEAMGIDTHVARVIQVELAKTKTRVPTRDIINASLILGDRCEVRQLLAFLTELLAPGVSVSTIFPDIGDFQSKLVACFHSNSNLHGVIMRHATALRIAPNHPHLPGTAIKLAQHMRRTFDMLPVIVDEPIDSYSTICRHLETIDLETIWGQSRFDVEM